MGAEDDSGAAHALQPPRTDPDVVAAFAALRTLIDESGYKKKYVADKLDIQPARLSRILNPEKHDANRDWRLIASVLDAIGQETGPFAAEWGHLWGLEPPPKLPLRVRLRQLSQRLGGGFPGGDVPVCGAHIRKWVHHVRRRWVAISASLIVILLIVLITQKLVSDPDPTQPDGSAQPPIPTQPSTPNMCASTIAKVGPECVGWTNGEFAFDPTFSPVMSRIAAENGQVQQSGAPVATLAYVLPVPKVKNILTVALRHELEGALLAQLRINHTSIFGERPRVRVVVVNVGEGNALWQEALQRQLIPSARSLNLVGVTGMGISLDTTRDEIDYLGSIEMPMFPSRLRADVLSRRSGQHVAGLYRVSPPTADQTRAGAAYLKNHSKSALIVADQKTSDAYNQALAARFSEAYTTPDPKIPPTTLMASEYYDSSLPDDPPSTPRPPDAPKAISDVVDSVCRKHPDAIYFAGRGVDLSRFIDALGARGLRVRDCEKMIFRVSTGDDGVSVTEQLKEDLPNNKFDLRDALDSGIFFTFTGLAHPAEWSARPDLFPRTIVSPFQESCAECWSTLFPQEDQEDGAGIVAYDALIVARTCLPSSGASSDQLAGPDKLVEQCARRDLSAPIAGASGPIAFNGDGVPINKLIPVVELHRDGTTALTR